MAKRLRSPYENAITIAHLAVSGAVPIVFNDYSHVWVVEQIAATYSNNTEAVACSVSQNGVIITGGPLIRSAIPGATNLVQTFAGDPYLYIEAADKTQVNFAVTGGEQNASGATATIYVQYRELSYNDPELAGRY